MSSKRSPAEICIAVFLSVLVSRLPMGMFLFPVPVFIVSCKAENPGRGILYQVIAYSAVLLWGFADYMRAGDSLFSRMYFAGLLCVATFVTFYSLFGNYSSVMLRKVFAASLLQFAAGSIFLVWLWHSDFDSAVAEITQIIGNVRFEQLPGVNPAELIATFLKVILCFILPVFLMLSFIPVFFGESAVNRFNPQWHDGFASMKMPKNMVWVLFGLFGVAVLSFVLRLPELLCVVLTNAALCFSIHYVINGLSVVYALIRRKNGAFSVRALVILFFIVSFLPGVGFFCSAALAFTGILENWVVLREESGTRISQ